MEVKENLQLILKNIEDACTASGRLTNEITIIAVTKYVSTERAFEAIQAGVTHLGENRSEGLLAKWEKLEDKPTWHFIGTLQTRKVKDIINKVDYIHSLDRISLAREIQLRATKPVKCLVQVNVSGEESKHGLKPEMVVPFIHSLKDFSHLSVVGLMTMAPLTEDKRLIRQCFKDLKNLQLQINQLQLPYAPCQEISMGMSNDYRIAIEEGATMIRIGTALVGE